MPTSHRQTEASCEVESITIDTFVEANTINRLDYIKIDVEGAELLVLKGAKRTIELLKPVVQVEVSGSFTKLYDYEPYDLFNFMAGTGYDYAFLGQHEDETGVGRLQTSTRLADDLAVSSEFFFFPKERPMNLLYTSQYLQPLKFPYLT